MQGSRQVHLLLTLDDFEVIDDRTAFRVRQCESGGIRNPAMNSSATRVNPEEMLEAKVVCDECQFTRGERVRTELTAKGFVDDFDGEADEFPTALAHCFVFTAGSN